MVAWFLCSYRESQKCQMGWHGTLGVFPLIQSLRQDFLHISDRLVGLCLAKPLKTVQLETPLWSAACPPREQDACAGLASCNTEASPHWLLYSLGSQPFHSCRQFLDCTADSSMQTHLLPSFHVPSEDPQRPLVLLAQHSECTLTQGHINSSQLPVVLWL